jgi:DNA-binding PucR family transcriptional regulator
MIGGSGNSPTVKITVGVGSLAVGPAELRLAEQEARQSLEVADAMGIRNVDVDLQSLGSYSLLTALGPAEADAFADRYLGPVRRYDAKHGSDLAETVTAYVDTGGSIAATAERLHIHASTLKYRLKRVQELTGMSLAHPEHRLSFALACRIVRLRKVSGN